MNSSDSDSNHSRGLPSVVSKYEPIRGRGLLHRLTVKLLWLSELQSEIEQAQRRNHSESKRHSPRSSKMIFRKDQYQDHGYDCCDDKAKVDLDIGKQNKPSISSAGLELSPSSLHRPHCQQDTLRQFQYRGKIDTQSTRSAFRSASLDSGLAARLCH